MALTNNDIFKKLRVAHKLTNDDIVDICALNGFKVSKSELGAIFRREDHPKYKECGDQFLRNFLDGLIVHLRGPMPVRKHKKSSPKFSSTPENKSGQSSQSSGPSKKSHRPRIKKK